MASINKYAGNVGRSLMYSVPGVIKNKLMPRTASNISANKDVIKEAGSIVKDARKVIKQKGLWNAINSSESQLVGDFKAGASQIGSSIKTGKFYDPKRQEESMDAIMSSGMDFDDGTNFDNMFDDIDTDDNDMFDDIEDGVSEKSSSKTKETSSTNFSKSETKNFKSVVDGRKYTSNNQQVYNMYDTNAIQNSTRQTIGVSTVIAQKQINAINSITDVLTKMQQFNIDQTQAFYQESTRYFSTTSGLLSDLSGTMRSLEDMTKLANTFNGITDKSNKFSNGETQYGRVFSADGGYNLREHLKIAKNKAFDDGGMGDVIRDIIRNPVDKAFEGLTQSLIPKDLRSKMGQTDQVLGSFMPNMMMYFNKMSKSDNPIMKKFGEIFGVSDGGTGGDLKFGGVSNGNAARFDGLVKKTIVTVIPSLLSKILRSVDKSKMYGGEELIFDHRNGSFKGSNQIINEFNDEHRSRVMNPYSEITDKVTNQLNKSNSKASNEERRAIQDKTHDQLFKFYTHLTNSRELATTEDMTDRHKFLQTASNKFFENIEDPAVRRSLEDVFKNNKLLLHTLSSNTMAARENLRDNNNRLNNNLDSETSHLHQAGDTLSLRNRTSLVANTDKARDSLSDNTSILHHAKTMKDRRIEHDRRVRTARINYGEYQKTGQEYEGYQELDDTNMNNITKTYRKPFTFVGKMLHNFNEQMTHLFFGVPAEKVSMGNLDNLKGGPIINFFKKAFSTLLGVKMTDKKGFLNREGGLLGKLKDFFKNLNAPMMNFLIGKRDGSGKRHGGLFDKTFGEAGRVMKDFASNMNTSVFGKDGFKGKGKDIFQSTMDKTINPVLDTMLGKKTGKDGKRKGGYIPNSWGKLEKSLFGRMDKNGDRRGGLIDQAIHSLNNKIIDPLATNVFGHKGKNGKRNGGLLGKTSKVLFGKLDKDGKRDGTGLIGQMKHEIKRDVIKPLKESLFGRNLVDKDGNVTYKDGLFESIGQSLKDVFGKESMSIFKDDVKDTVSTFIGKPLSNMYNDISMYITGKDKSGKDKDSEGSFLKDMTKSIKETVISPLKTFLFGETNGLGRRTKDGALTKLIDFANDDVWKPLRDSMADNFKDFQKFFKTEVFDKITRETFAPFAREFKYQLDETKKFIGQAFDFINIKFESFLTNGIGLKLSNTVDTFLINPLKKGLSLLTKGTLGLLKMSTKAAVWGINAPGRLITNRQLKRAKTPEERQAILDNIEESKKKTKDARDAYAKRRAERRKERDEKRAAIENKKPEVRALNAQETTSKNTSKLVELLQKLTNRRKGKDTPLTEEPIDKNSAEYRRSINISNPASHVDPDNRNKDKEDSTTSIRRTAKERLENLFRKKHDKEMLDNAKITAESTSGIHKGFKGVGSALQLMLAMLPAMLGGLGGLLTKLGMGKLGGSLLGAAGKFAGAQTAADLAGDLLPDGNKNTRASRRAARREARRAARAGRPRGKFGRLIDSTKTFMRGAEGEGNVLRRGGRRAATGTGNGLKALGRGAKGLLGSKAARIGGKLLGKAALPLALISAGFDGFSGYQDAGKMFGTDKATTGQKLSGGLAGILSGLTLGIVPAETFAKPIYDFSNKVGSFFKDIGKGIAKFFTGAYKWVKSIPKKIFGAVTKGIKKVMGMAKSVGKWVGKKAKAVIGTLKKIVSAVLEPIKHVGGNLKKVGKSAWSGIKSAGSKVGGWFGMGGDEKAINPGAGYPLTSDYGVRKSPFKNGLAFHKGLDFAMPEGSSVKSFKDGKVSKIGKDSTLGNYIEISHGGGKSSRYGHLSNSGVKRGESVKAGQPIGASGNTGKSTGAHLHFETLQNGKQVNPKAQGGIWDSIKSFGSKIDDSTGNIFSKTFNKVKDFGSNVYDKMTSNASKNISGISNLLGLAKEKATDGFNFLDNKSGGMLGKMFKPMVQNTEKTNLLIEKGAEFTKKAFKYQIGNIEDLLAKTLEVASSNASGGGGSSATPSSGGSSGASASSVQGGKLGWLAGLGESGGNYASVNYDHGGQTLGKYQLAMSGGLPAFNKWLKKTDSETFKKLNANGGPGSKGYEQAWVSMAKEKNSTLNKMQDKYMKHDYNGFLKKFESDSGVKLKGRSTLLGEMIYSRYNNLGSGLSARAVKGAGLNNKMSDAELIKGFYNHIINNVQSYWKSSPNVWKGIRNRNTSERDKLLGMIKNKGDKKFKGGPGVQEKSDAKSTANLKGKLSVKKSTSKFNPEMLKRTMLRPLGNAPFMITSKFGRRVNPITGKGAEMHEGIDVKAETGQPVVASMDGKVVSAGNEGSYGNLVVLEHADGVQTRYGHLSRITVRKNQKVKRGQVIGYSGNTGRSTGSHLHYEIRKDGRPLNPQSLVGGDILDNDMKKNLKHTGGPNKIDDMMALAKSQLGKLTYTQSAARNAFLEGTGNTADCSSFVRGVYKKTTGMDIGSYTGEQVSKKMGTKITDPKKIKPGDAVFFGNTGHHGGHGSTGVSHVGLAIGGGKMIDHGLPKGANISGIQDSYWKPKYLFAKRYLNEDGSKANYSGKDSGKGGSEGSSSGGSTAEKASPVSLKDWVSKNNIDLGGTSKASKDTKKGGKGGPSVAVASGFKSLFENAKNVSRSASVNSAASNASRGTSNSEMKEIIEILKEISHTNKIISEKDMTVNIKDVPQVKTSTTKSNNSRKNIFNTPSMVKKENVSSREMQSATGIDPNILAIARGE